MASHSLREFEWSNGTNNFCLRIGEVLTLEEKCGAGIGTIALRLETGNYYVNDIRETIRLGLQGGGMKADQARKVVERHVDEHPLAEATILAYEILKAYLLPPPGPQPGKMQADQTTMETPSSETTGDLSDPQSMPQGQASDGPPETPTSTPSGSSHVPLMDTMQSMDPSHPPSS